jgi:hypothetical protein
MTSELASLSGKHLTTIHVDNGMAGPDQTFVWLRHLSEGEISELEDHWVGLHAPYQFDLAKVDVSLATRLGVALPESAPLWDETFPGTYGEWLALRERAEESTRDFNKELSDALGVERAKLFIDAGAGLCGELWLDGCHRFAFGYGHYGVDGEQLWLSVHEGDLYASANPGAIDEGVFEAARLAGAAAHAEAHAANIAGVRAMDAEDLIELRFPVLSSVTIDPAFAQHFSYPEWVATAESLRGDILVRLENGEDSELDDIGGSCLFFVISPEEARESAAEAVLHKSHVYVVPPKVVETLLGLVGEDDD